MTDATVMMLSDKWLLWDFTWLLWFAAGCFLIAMGLTLRAIISHAKGTDDEEEAILDWRPTLRMDAHLSKFGWLVRSQDIRLIASVSGEPHAELRWRASSLDEVKRFVSVYHKAMREEIEKRAKNHRSPELPHASPANHV